MILSLRAIKRRIRSVESTKKITRAMQMISTTKLNRSEQMLYKGRPYYFKLDLILQKLLSGLDEKHLLSHPLLEKRKEIKRIAVCVIASDTGLCGIYNNNILKITENFLRKYRKDSVILVTVGHMAYNYFSKRNYSIIRSYMGLYGSYNSGIADKISEELSGIFISGQADEVYIVNTHYESALKLSTKVRKFLNIEGIAPKEEYEFIAEPDIDTILKDLLPRYLSIKMRMILLDAFTSEHSARMMAMQTATENAKELINDLTLIRNKARQAAITTEVIEVASSAEALKG